MNLSKEETLIFDILKSEIFNDRKGEGYSFNTEKLDWNYLLDTVNKNGISNIFYKHLITKKEFSINIPENIIERLKNGYYFSLNHNIRMLDEIEHILRALKKDGIKIILLKGGALLETVYKDPAFRGMFDIDILIKPEDFIRFDKGMKEIGYMSLDNIENITLPSVNPYLNTFVYQGSGNNHPLHIHWHIVNSTLPTHSYIYKIDMNKLWYSAYPSFFGKEEGLILSPVHTIMSLSEHGLRIGHSFNKLILLLDIAKVIYKYNNEIDWDELIKESKIYNIDRMIFYSLVLCKEYFDIEIKTEIIEKTRPAKITAGERWFMKKADSHRLEPGVSYPIHLAMNKGILDKALFLFRTILPPSSVMEQRGYKKPGVQFFSRIFEIWSQVTAYHL